jgi:hypothetical protein
MKAAIILSSLLLAASSLPGPSLHKVPLVGSYHIRAVIKNGQTHTFPPIFFMAFYPNHQVAVGLWHKGRANIWQRGTWSQTHQRVVIKLYGKSFCYRPLLRKKALHLLDCQRKESHILYPLPRLPF